MQSIEILLDSITKVKGFVNLVAAYDGDFDLASERYVVDAKSIMGIFSLDLSKPLKLNVHNETKIEDLKEKLIPYLA